MTRDFIYRQILPWLEHELQNYDVRPHGPIKARQAAAASLANHLWNNAEQIKRAEAAKRMGANIKEAYLGTSDH